jgi:deazaflavin-dependent oxidoreductase (nitroreductase family)
MAADGAAPRKGPTAPPTRRDEEWLELNRAVIEEFRANGGRCGGAFEGNPMVLLTTTGARSGQPRVSPLTYTTDGDRWVLIASKAGAPHHPAWYHNIVAHPEVTLEVGDERFPARAAVVTGDERERLYAERVAVMPRFGRYRELTDREIPVVVISRK